MIGKRSKDLRQSEISEAGLSQSVIVKSDGVLTVDSENASVFELTLEGGCAGRDNECAEGVQDFQNQPFAE